MNVVLNSVVLPFLILGNSVLSTAQNRYLYLQTFLPAARRCILYQKILYLGDNGVGLASASSLYISGARIRVQEVKPNMAEIEELLDVKPSPFLLFLSARS